MLLVGDSGMIDFCKRVYGERYKLSLVPFEHVDNAVLARTQRLNAVEATPNCRWRCVKMAVLFCRYCYLVYLCSNNRKKALGNDEKQL